MWDQRSRGRRRLGPSGDGDPPSGLLPQSKAPALPSCRRLGNSLSFLTDKWV